MFRYLYIIISALTLVLVVGNFSHLYTQQRGEIIIEKKNSQNENKVEEVNNNQEDNKITKKEIFKEEFKKDTREWKIKIYISYIIFFISFIVIIKNLKRRKLYK